MNLRKMTLAEEEAVNAFIPIAAKAADKAVPDWHDEKGRNAWTAIYVAKMNELTIGARLRVDLK